MRTNNSIARIDMSYRKLQKKNKSGAFKILARGVGGEQPAWMNPETYLKYKNSAVLNDRQLSKEIEKVAAATAAELCDDSDDEVINVNPIKARGWKTEYFRVIKSEKYMNKNKQEVHKTYFACLIEGEDGT